MIDAKSQAMKTIDALPDRLKADYGKNKNDFAGSTVQMDTAGGNMVSNLKNMWIDVVNEALPGNRFSVPADKWIEDYIEKKRDFYSVISEPDGPGTGGTIVGQLVLGGLMGDLQDLIRETVEALISFPDNMSTYERWEGRWKAAQQ